MGQYYVIKYPRGTGYSNSLSVAQKAWVLQHTLGPEYSVYGPGNDNNDKFAAQKASDGGPNCEDRYWVTKGCEYF